MSRTKRALSWVWAAGPALTIAGAVAVILEGVLPLVSLWALKLVVDAIARVIGTGHANGSALVGPLLLAGGAAAAGVIVGAVQRLITLAHSEAVREYMSGLLHAQSIRLDLGYYEDPEFHDTAHRAQEDAPQRPARVLAAVVGVCQSAVLLALVAVLLLTVAWWVPVALTVAAVPGVWARLHYSRAGYEWELRRTPDSRLGYYYNWVLTRDFHAKEVRLLGFGPVLAERAAKLRGLLRRERVELATRRAGAELAGDLLMTVVAYGLLALLAVRAADGHTSLGSVVLYFAAVQRCQLALTSLLGGMVDLYENSLFIENLIKFLDLPAQLPEPAAPRSVPRRISDGIELRDVSYTYHGAERPALDRVSLRIDAGEHVALVGANGAGKTTLVKLLCRLYDPDHGALTVDGIDVRELESSRWRDELAVVFQDFGCYQMTARENIWLGDSNLDPNDRRIPEAARAAAADELLAGLPSGYDTRLGRWFENATDLSIGEWQKVALARAFLRRSQVVILDEPTSALDAGAERELLGRFRELTAGRTAIVVSHRLSTVRMADRIVVLERGRIVQTGTHRELIDAEGVYADMYADQAARYAPVR